MVTQKAVMVITIHERSGMHSRLGIYREDYRQAKNTSKIGIVE